MSQTDPIADMFTVIRNGNTVSKKSVVVPYSGMKERILAVLKEEGYIEDYRAAEVDAHRKIIKIYLKYGKHGEKTIRTIKRVSKPGRRIYRKIGELPPVLNGLGIHILSTSRGVISDRKAREEKVGGEVLATVW